MRIPRIRDYNNTHWVVGDEVYKCTVHKKLPLKNNGEAFGLCDQAKKKIKLAAWQGKIEGLRTLLHELLHAVEQEYQITLNHETLDIVSIAIADILIMNGFIDVQK